MIPLKYTILENGLDFVYDAINNLSIANKEHIEEDAKERLIKYALLHLSSGAELIFKSRLLDENWAYVFSDINKAKKTAFEAGDFTSVDSESTVSRLENFCGITFSDDDKKFLKNLRKRRNKVEHFEINDNVLAIENYIYKGISILMRFVAEQYEFEDFSENEYKILCDIKRIMLKLQKHYAELKLLAEKELKSHDNMVITCPECEEEFLLLGDCGVKCCFCGYQKSGKEAANDYIHNILGIDEYSTIKDGDEYPLYDCPECGDDALVYDWEKGRAICFSCDYKERIEKLSFCIYCGAVYKKAADEDLGMCPECITYKINKKD